MNKITRYPLHKLGYDFIPAPYLPQGEDEYYLRNRQNRSKIVYRQLTAYEIEILVRNRNQSDNWNNILVANEFNPELVKNCKFYGLVRIGKLESCFLEYHNLRMPVGLYNSIVISCDIGDNVVIDNVNYLAHYIIGNEVVIVNVNEMATTSHAKFGNGIIKEGEEENIRIWLELCNENGGRRVVPFSGMLPGDAWLWSKFRGQKKMLGKLLQFTEDQFDKKRGYYGKVGDRSIIKNTAIIKDVWIGSDAYIKGANKLKNLTIHSNEKASAQVGEGCELVNGIVGEGCRIFYGVKAVRFVMASHSQLKYGARLINSYLGNNATISCCEVLNSLIFPAHEQHHNNSFLCAALVMGQSNMAAGATIGSNHNSRGADGELVAGRGFWPGLCVSLKHNSVFAPFTMLAKGDFPAELHIPFPFSLVSNDVSNDRLNIMPAYWFQYNMYALARNSWKYRDRDKRIQKVQYLETAYLAPDTMESVSSAIGLLETAVGKALLEAQPNTVATSIVGQDEAIKKPLPSPIVCQRKGRKALEIQDSRLQGLEIRWDAAEHGKRPVVLLKATTAWGLYKKLISTYFAESLTEWLAAAGLDRLKPADIRKKLLGLTIGKTMQWENVGGQLIPQAEVKELIQRINNGVINGWSGIHEFYQQQGLKYPEQKMIHALQLALNHTEEKFKSLQEMKAQEWKKWFNQIIGTAIETRQYLSHQVYLSRAKDYENPFRNMVYSSDAERDEVLGKLEENQFIAEEKKTTAGLIRKWKKWTTAEEQS
jgi:hypothetical protein